MKLITRNHRLKVNGTFYHATGQDVAQALRGKLWKGFTVKSNYDYNLLVKTIENNKRTEYLSGIRKLDDYNAAQTNLDDYEYAVRKIGNTDTWNAFQKLKQEAEQKLDSAKKYFLEIKTFLTGRGRYADPILRKELGLEDMLSQITATRKNLDTRLKKIYDANVNAEPPRELD